VFDLNHEGSVLTLSFGVANVLDFAHLSWLTLLGSCVADRESVGRKFSLQKLLELLIF
jgi:hypothetical protein